MVLYVLQTSYEFLNHTILAQNMEEELHLLRQQALRTLPSPSVSDSFVCLVFLHETLALRRYYSDKLLECSLWPLVVWLLHGSATDSSEMWKSWEPWVVVTWRLPSFLITFPFQPEFRI